MPIIPPHFPALPAIPDITTKHAGTKREKKIRGALPPLQTHESMHKLQPTNKQKLHKYNTRRYYNNRATDHTAITQHNTRYSQSTSLLTTQVPELHKLLPGIPPHDCQLSQQVIGPHSLPEASHYNYQIPPYNHSITMQFSSNPHIYYYNPRKYKSQLFYTSIGMVLSHSSLPAILSNCWGGFCRL